MLKISLNGVTAIVFAGLVSTVLTMSPNAIAQDDESSQVDAWLKICNTDKNTEKELCLTSQELRTASGQFLASVAIRSITGEARKTMNIAVPLGMLIQPGLRAGVDDGEKLEVKFGICFPNACFAELVIEDEFINSMKKGNTLIVTALNQQAKPVPFKLTLSGFTDAYEGEPVDAEELQKKQLQLKEDLDKRAKATRQRLIDEQKRASEESASESQGEETEEGQGSAEESTDNN